MGRGSAVPAGAAEPQPWQTDEDVRGWRTVYRGTGQRREPPLATVVVDLDAEQTAWVGREADRAGLTLVDFVKKLIDDARSAPSASRS